MFLCVHTQYQMNQFKFATNFRSTLGNQFPSYTVHNSILNMDIDIPKLLGQNVRRFNPCTSMFYHSIIHYHELADTLIYTNVRHCIFNTNFFALLACPGNLFALWTPYPSIRIFLKRDFRSSENKHTAHSCYSYDAGAPRIQINRFVFIC